MLSRRSRVPLSPLRSVAAAALLLAASACAETEDGPLVVEEPVGETTTTASAEAPSDPPRSEGTVEIGETVYRFAVDCHEQGAGVVVAVGAGEDPHSDGLVGLYVQASLSDPYVGVDLPDGTLVEPSLDSHLEIFLARRRHPRLRRPLRAGPGPGDG